MYIFNTKIFYLPQKHIQNFPYISIIVIEKTVKKYSEYNCFTFYHVNLHYITNLEYSLNLYSFIGYIYQDISI